MHHVMKIFALHHHSFKFCVQCVLWKGDELFCSKKGRILVPGRVLNANFQRLVIDHMISNGGDILTGYFLGAVSSVTDYFKRCRSCVAKLWNSACKRASIDPQWKGGNNPDHLHSQDLDLLEA